MKRGSDDAKSEKEGKRGGRIAFHIAAGVIAELEASPDILYLDQIDA